MLPSVKLNTGAIIATSILVALTACGPADPDPGAPPTRPGTPSVTTAKPTARPPTKPPAPKPTTTKPVPPVHTDPRYGTCAEAKSHGLGPYRRGIDPEYAWYRDSDKDGFVCE